MNHRTLKHAFAVYKIATGFQPGTFYIGCCPLRELSDMPDAWTYQAFVDQMADGNVSITMTVIGVCATEVSAETLQRTAVEAERVWCNLHSKRCERPRKPGRMSVGKVRNVTTNTEYASAAEAARSIDVSAAAMSLHLAGKTHTLKGQRFVRVVE